METVWQIFSDYLFFIKHAYNLQIHSFVLMNNHFHLLVTTPDANLSMAMNYFMRETSRALSTHTGRINHNYGGRFNRSLLLGYHNYCNVYKYLYRNPVEAGLVPAPEQYRYSTLNSKLGYSHSIIPFEEDTLLFDYLEQTLLWLNRPPDKENREAMRTALKRAQFTLALDRSTKKTHPLNSQLY